MLVEILKGKVARFSKVCSVTGEEYKVDAPMADCEKWMGGELIQNAMPYLDKDQREFLISENTPAEWDAMFAGHEE